MKKRSETETFKDTNKLKKFNTSRSIITIGNTKENLSRKGKRMPGRNTDLRKETGVLIVITTWGRI